MSSKNCAMASRCRDLTEADKTAVGEAIKKAFLKAKGSKTWLSRFSVDDKDRTVNCIYNNISSVVIDDTYLLCYDVIEPWYCEDKLLLECLVMRLNKNNKTFDVVLEALDWLAEINECVGIVSSTALSPDDKILKKLYKGYQVTATEMYRGV